MAAWTWRRKKTGVTDELASDQRPGVQTQMCDACGAIQELPAIFCERCGAPLLKITKFLLMFFLTVTLVSYVLYGLYVDKLSWPAPLYGYYVFIFVAIGLIITRRYMVMSVRVFLWSSLLAYATWMLMLSVSSVLEYITSDLSDLIRTIETSPSGPMVILVTVVLELIFAFVVLVRRFRFTLAYRLFATLMAVAALVLRYAFSYSIGETGATVSPKLSDWFLWAPETTVKELFELLSVNIMRALVAEMAVYSLVKSYAPAMERYHQVVGKMIAEPGTSQAGFTSAATQVTRGIIRAGIYLEQFVLMFVHTFLNYLHGLYRVIRRVVLDLVTPIVTLAMIAFLLGLLSEHTAAYLTGKLDPKLIWVGPWRSPLVMMAICMVAVFGVQIVFLRSVTKFSFRAIWRCNTLLLLWVAPFFFAFFVLISISLVVTGGVLRRWGNDSFPYHFGPLTIAAIVGTIVMMAFAIINSRRAARRSAALPPTPEMETVQAQHNDSGVAPPETTEAAGAGEASPPEPAEDPTGKGDDAS